MDIVVGALRTPAGEAAVHRAVREAQERSATLHLVGHVAMPRMDDQGSDYLIQAEALRRDVEAWATETVPDGVAVTVHVPPGFVKPSDSILHVREQLDAELVVIGLRKRSRVGKALLGSNAQDILLNARCEVLSVPDPDSLGI